MVGGKASAGKRGAAKTKLRVKAKAKAKAVKIKSKHGKAKPKAGKTKPRKAKTKPAASRKAIKPRKRGAPRKTPEAGASVEESHGPGVGLDIAKGGMTTGRPTKARGDDVDRSQRPTKSLEEASCPDCGSPSLITDYKHGEVVCKKCGLVLEEEIFDFGPEWRAFDEEQKSKRARTGGPVKFAKLNKGLTTEIDRYDRDIRGGAIQPERKAQLYRLRKWQRRSRMSDSVQRNLSIALPELDRMCAYLNIPNNIKEECAMWYRKAVSKGLVRGRSIESVVAAIIYLISRKHSLPKTLEELADASGVKKKDIGRSYRFACRRLDIRMPVATPMDYVPRFASELGLSGETEAKAIEILQKAREKGVTSGRGPTGVAAAAIYLAGKLTNDKQTQKGIAGRLAGVTEVTIRNRYEEIARELDIEV